MIPDFPTDDATVEEKPTDDQMIAPGSPDSRILVISNGPRDADTPVIDNWLNELLDAEFEDINVVSVETDRTYVGETTADWTVTIKYEHPDRNTYRIPLRPVGEVHVDAVTPEEALEQASKLFHAGSTVEKRDRAELCIALENLSTPESVDAVQRIVE